MKKGRDEMVLSHGALPAMTNVTPFIMFGQMSLAPRVLSQRIRLVYKLSTQISSPRPEWLTTTTAAWRRGSAQGS